MNKKWLLLFLITFSLVFITACVEPAELTAITYSGVADQEIENGVEFNFLTGVTATGNDGVDYTDQIVMTTTSSAVNIETGALDTTNVGVHAVRYEVVVGEVVARQFRYITVKSPTVAEGEMLVNKDLSQGVLGWNDPSVVYVADGAAMTLTEENGALKAEVVSGANFFTPRFGQMNIPFELGKTYEVSFDAKSSVEKEIALQVGELLPSAPWFNDFLPSAENIFYRTITTEWATYSYKFTHTQDNQAGGILFGLGTVKGQDIDATMYFDNFDIKESTPDADTTGPVISGVESKEIVVGASYDPLTGLKALDVTDGDVTANVTVVIKDSQNNVVNAVDTSVEGVFTVTYSVSDSLSNDSELVITITVVAEVPEPQWIGYGVEAMVETRVTYSGTTDQWWNNNAQLTLDAFDGTQATATFKFVGVAGQSYLFKVEGGGKAVEDALVADGTLQTKVLDLSGLTEAERNGLTLAIVFAQTLNGAGTMVLYTVEEATVSEPWAVYGMTAEVVNAFNFPAPDPNAWWNNNIQLQILSFDGDNDLVTFSFKGEAGVEYLFKIEGNGNFVETPIVANGEVQEHVLDLTNLSKAARDGLNLLIVFDKNSADGSRLEIYSIEYSVSQEPDWIGYGMTIGERTLVTYSGTTASWWNNNIQLRFDAFDGTKTTATFQFVGVAGQSYLFKVEGGGAAVEDAIVADGTLQTKVLDLSGLSEAQRNGLTLAVVFAQTLDGAGTIELFTVEEATITQSWIAYGMTLQTVKTLNFPAPDPNAWWNNNAQLTILAFDGANTKVSFTFVGEAGVEYLFKIEGNGQAYELAVTATGEMQTHVLNLSAMTSEQRAGLNLIVVFDKNSTDDGSTLNLYAVEYFAD